VKSEIRNRPIILNVSMNHHRLHVGLGHVGFRLVTRHLSSAIREEERDPICSQISYYSTAGASSRPTCKACCINAPWSK